MCTSQTYQSVNVDSSIQLCNCNVAHHRTFSAFRKFLWSYPFRTPAYPSHPCIQKTPRKSEDPMIQPAFGCSCLSTELTHLVSCCMSQSAYLFVTQQNGLKFHPGYFEVALLIFYCLVALLIWFYYGVFVSSLSDWCLSCFQFWASMTKATIITLSTGPMWMCFLLSRAIT